MTSSTDLETPLGCGSGPVAKGFRRGHCNVGRGPTLEEATPAGTLLWSDPPARVRESSPKPQCPTLWRLRRSQDLLAGTLS